MLRDVDAAVELVVCGHTQAWNESLIQTLKSHMHLVDHFSIHRYWIDAGPGNAFTEADYYRGIREADETEDFVAATRKLLDEVDPTRRIGIALDEWGVWHPEARPWGPGATGDCSGEYAQPATLRDAVMTAVALEGFHRQCRNLSLANLAQIVNVLHAPIQTDGAEMWTTPTYHLLLLHASHIGQTAVQTEVKAPNLPGGGCSLSATASTGTTGHALTLVNRHYRDALTVQLPSWVTTGRLLTAGTPRAANTKADPTAVSLVDITITNSTIELPPHSVATLT